MNTREIVAKHIFDIDEWFHKHKIHIAPFCLAADITVGWGPDASDWDKSKTRFLEWFYNWYWQDHCTTCFGTGEQWLAPNPFMKNASVGPTWINMFKRENCRSCNGTGTSR